MKYVIDANIFLRIFANDDKKKAQECGVLIRAITDGKINAYTTSITIAEVVWTLQSFYSYNKENVVEAVKSITGINSLAIIDNYNHSIAFSLFEKNNVKFIDCLLASIPEIQKKEWAIISYDKDFDRLKIIRKEPGKITLGK